MLPPLRQDLSLHSGPLAEDGSPTWVLHDPPANRFYSLSWPAFELLSRWPLGDPAAVLAGVNQQTTLSVDGDDLDSLVKFLAQYHLLDAQAPADTKRLLRAAEAMRLSPAQWLLKNYLFLRVPLLRPAHWLDRCAPFVAWVYRPAFWVAIMLCAIVGVCLAARQWDTFIGTFSQYKSLGGLIAIAGALSLAKILHELGHAFTAQRYGCRVSTMGVAFLVMLPVLYTDTNEAWKIADKRQRLRIAAAGVAAELALGAIATLAWNFLPDGPVRAGVFLLATTTWILTLVINASPFMRFDGYFLLCDWLDMPNLHSRSFAFGRWWLRRVLFGWPDAAPEHFKPARRRFLIAFAFATWCYRLGVFLGIAYLVYDAVFKLLGVFLLIVELGFFIVAPMFREFEVWWRRREELTWNFATRRSLCVLAVAAAVVFLPLQRDIRAPAVLGAAQSQELYAVAAGRVVGAPVPVGSRVKEGDVLVRLESPDLVHQLGLARNKAQRVRWELDSLRLDAKLLDENAALQERWAAASAEVAGLEAQVDELTVRAPFAGRVVYVDDALVPGSWVSVHEKLVHVAGLAGAKGEVLVREDDLPRLTSHAAVFVSERAEQGRIPCAMGAVDRINLSALDAPYFASTYGGPVRVQADPGGALLPTETVFRARLVDCRTAGAPPQELRGTAHILGDATSFAGDLLRRAMRAVQRELGR